MSDSFANVAKRVEKLRDDLEDGFESTTRDETRKMEGEVQIELANNDSIAHGTLLDSVSYTERRGSPLLIHTSVEAAPWGRYVEYGTGSRASRDTQPNHRQYKSADPKPPLEPILSWVVEKGITPTEYDTQYGLAIALQETLGEMGQIPRPFMRPVWFDASRGYRAVVDANHDTLKSALRRF